MGELTGLLDILINLFTKRDERHNRALRDIMDLSRDIAEFFVKYNLQEKNSAFRLTPENMGQAKVAVITIAYKTRTRIKIAKDIKSKNLPPLLEEVHSDLEMVKRALFNPTLGNAVLDEVVSKLHKSFKQLINEASNIEAEEARRRERKEIEQQAKEQTKREIGEAKKVKKAKERGRREAKKPQEPMLDIQSKLYEGDVQIVVSS